MNDFLHGMVIKLACASLPVRKVYADVLDNEWPIIWTSRSVKNNKTYLNGTMTFRRVSDAVGYDYANAAAAVTMVGDGFTETFTTENIGVTDTSLGKLIYIRCTLSGTTFILALLVIETPGFEGAVEFTETGTYYAFLNSSYVNVEINNADVQFELTAPRLIGYMYNDVGPLPALPEWDRVKYPYALIFDGGPLWVMDSKPYMNYSSTNAAYADYEVYTVQEGAYVLSNSGNNVNVNSGAIWSNTDIYYYDTVADVGGTLFLEASDPVPVYE